MTSLRRSVASLSCLLGLGLAAGCGGGGGGSPDAGPADAGDVDSGGDTDGGLPPPRMETEAGPVVGERGEGYEAFLGIPYAAPPVGELRWRPPEPPAAWEEPLDATARPPRCPQSNTGGLTLPGQEDCLYLNVHVPSPRPEAAPVMVWLHGGGFVFGEGLQTDGGTAGDRLAANEGVVVVSLNYRLGPIGFLAHEALSAERDESVSGNYGLLDQIAALEWVRDNIAAVGGDPGNVTVFGESAGGMSVCLHMIAPQSEGLFHRAVTQSGLCGSDRATLLAEGETQGQRVAAELGCDGADDVAACLRAAPVEDVMAALPPPPDLVSDSESTGDWGPVVDGWVVPDRPGALLEAGDFTQVPTIVGWNGDEGTLFVMLVEQSMERDFTEADYMDALAELAAGLPVTVEDLTARYPLADYPDPGAAAADALGDYALACPSRLAAKHLSAHVPTWVYHFTYPNAAFQIPPTRELGAFHSAEIQYVFGHPSELGASRFTDATDSALHEAMRGYWTRFARGADPNGGDATSWPRYDVEGDRHLVLDATIEASTGADADDCDFWEANGLR